MSDQMRTFIAVDIPEEIRSKIGSLHKELNIDGLKLVDPSLVHLTLKFLGDTPGTKIDEVCRVLDTIETGALDMRMQGMGVFPNLKNPRVVWIGFEGDSKLRRIVEFIEDELSAIGFSRERKKFTSHLTIARVKRAGKRERSLIADFVRDNANIDLGKILVDKIKLKKSVLTPRGPIYTDIFTKELKNLD